MKLSLNITSRTLLAAAALFAGLTATSASAQSLVPIPFATTVAGVAAGSGNTQCASTDDIANNAGAHLGDGCLPTQASIVGSYGAFTDTLGNVYLTENGTQNDIRVIYKGGTALTAMLIAANANLTNFTPVAGRIYTLAGGLAAALTVKNGSKYSCNGQTTGAAALDSGGNGCPAGQAYLKPRGMAVDANGNVFFVTSSPGITLRVIYAGGTQVANLITLENPGTTPQVGYVYKLSGQSSAGYLGDGGLASAAGFIVLRDVIVDPSGNIFLSDGTSTATSGNNVRRIDGTTGIITTYAGAAGCTSSSVCSAGDTGDGAAATAALLNGPYSLFLDRNNNLFITEYLGDRVRVVYNSGTVPGLTNPVAGNIYTFTGAGTLTADGTAAASVKMGIVNVGGVDQAGNIYVEDSTSKRLWRFDALTGIGYVIAGRASGSAPASGAFCSGTAGPQSVDTLGDGCPGIFASISDAGRVSFDPQGNAYLGENGNGVIRKLSYNTQFANTAVGSTSSQYLAFESLSALTLATENLSQQGSTTTEFTDSGTGTCTATSALTAAQLCTFNIAFKPTHAGLRPAALKLSTASTLLTTALLSGVGVAADLAIDPASKVSAGSGLKPSGVVADLFGNLYVSDQTGNRVLKGSTSGTTLTSLVTGLSAPSGLALDTLGNLYIADTGNNRVLEVTSAGATIAALGTGLSGPKGVAVDAFGNVFIADTGNNRIVQLATNGVQTLTPVTGLSAPTQLAFDASGDLFITDTGNKRVVELATNSGQSTVTLPTGTAPTAVATAASGTLYVADATTLEVLGLVPGSATTSVLASGLTTPVALATDADASLYLADAGLTTVSYYRRNLASVSFPITNVNQTSTGSVNLANVGNAALTFPSAASLYTLTGSSYFTLAPATTSGCGAGISFGAGSGCSFTASYTPLTTGAATASVAFNTNATNTTTATVQLVGNGQLLVATTTTLAVTSPSGSIVYGQPVVLTATVTPVSNVGTPTGTVTFTIDNKAQTPVAYGTGTYSLTLSPTVGTHVVSIAFSGDGLYASSAATVSFVVSKAPTTTALTVTPVNNSGSISLTFSAKVASATATTETGTVTFYAGTTALSTVALSTSTLTASYTTTATTFTSNSFTAVYSGDTNFSGSTSAIYAPSGDFAIGTSTSAVTLPQGGVANVGFTLAALYGSTGTITPTCTGLPANSVCRFYPTTVALNGNVAIQLQLYTNTASNQAANEGLTRHQELFLATLLPLALLGLTRRSRRLRGAALLCALFLLSLAPLAGCGSGSPAATQSDGLITPVGTSTVTVVFTGTAPLTTHTTSFTLTVIANNTSY